MHITKEINAAIQRYVSAKRKHDKAACAYRTAQEMFERADLLLRTAQADAVEARQAMLKAIDDAA